MAHRKIFWLPALFPLAFALPAQAEDRLFWAGDDHVFTLGVEGFRDRYREPDPGIELDSRADYGSINAGYTYSAPNGYYASIEARGSYGREDYKSVSGTIDDIPQYETEARLLIGKIFPTTDENRISPYIGAGSRFYYDNSKGEITDLGFYGYDRRILQFYGAAGLTYKYKSGDWVYVPNIEYNQLIRGRVNSRLGNVPGYFNVTNTQDEGYGWRGEFMIGQEMANYRWEVGPFFRYWHVSDSELDTDANGITWLEPKNTRLQAGGVVRVRF